MKTCAPFVQMVVKNKQRPEGQKPWWTAKDGRAYMVDELPASYLRNIINMIRRQQKELTEILIGALWGAHTEWHLTHMVELARDQYQLYQKKIQEGEAELATRGDPKINIDRLARLTLDQAAPKPNRSTLFTKPLTNPRRN